MKPRIFIGIREFGDIGLLYSRGLHELGFPVSTVMIEQPDNPRRPYSPDSPEWDRHDVYIRKSKGRLGQLRDCSLMFLRSVKDYDVFMFLGASSFFNSLPVRYGLDSFQFLDWRVFRALGKKIIVVATGTDLRSYPAMIEELRSWGLSSHASFCQRELGHFGAPDGRQRRKARRVERLAHHVITQPDMATHLACPYRFYWVPVDLAQLSFRWQEPQKPLIVHAPSDQATKGTKYVLETINRLLGDGLAFEFQLIENLNNDDMRRLLQRSHIVIDQLLLPGYGLLGVEAMATGNVVVGSAVAGYNGFPESLPIITSTPDNLYDNLKNLLNDRASWADIARRGRAYVEQYHDYRKVTENLADIILGEGPEKSRAEVRGPVQNDKVARTH